MVAMSTVSCQQVQHVGNQSLIARICVCDVLRKTPQVATPAMDVRVPVPLVSVSRSYAVNQRGMLGGGGGGI